LRTTPLLVFDFHGERKIFTSPIAVYCTDKIHEIKPIFDKVQKAIDSDLYVAGYVSYEAAPAFSDTFSVRAGARLPLVWFGVFERPETELQLEQGGYRLERLESDTTIEQYNDAIHQIKQLIASGDTYQVNYTTRLRSDFQGDDYAFYEYLRSAQAGKYSAYLNIGEQSLLSVSPELFFQWDGRRIVTKPMKGTSKRGASNEEDQALEQELYHSDKNRAENVMIVDLLRNDLSKIARLGTVHVSKLFEIEAYPTLFQMTSTVEATTEDGIGLYDIFAALFPCGSITGAPKIRTTEIITGIEQSPREVYCGAIGLMEPGNKATFNVSIRTAIIDAAAHTAEYGVGGGIVWDSSAEGEYEETVTKAKVFTGAIRE
jgi:para-aminobenzoate synthetase/4-amino-4-deoxychorismate lyase